jgi:hypothetical protein
MNVVRTVEVETLGVETLEAHVGIDEYQLDGRSLREWHEWLTKTRLAAQALHPSSSRKGRHPAPEKSAWLAIALELIYLEAYGTDPTVAGGLKRYLELVHHGSPDIEGLVQDYGYCLPGSLKPLIGWPST